MLYRRLTKEEFENLPEDFAIFLASNSIDKKEWDTIKEMDIKKADGLLDIFSDLVFEKEILQEEGVLIIEHSKHTDLTKHEKHSYDKRYGGNVFSFFEY